jgi:MYXO-CTERM domain-containing protein
MAEQTSKPAKPSQPSQPKSNGKAGQPGAPSAVSQSPDAIEAEIAQTRAHLASTIDELAVRAQPREIARRQTESVKVRLVEATHTPEGDLRVERVGAIAAAAAAVLVVLAVLRRRRRG